MLRTPKKLTIRCGISITECRACELLSQDQWRLLRYAVKRAHAACLGAQLLHVPGSDLMLTQTSLLSVCTKISKVV